MACIKYVQYSIMTAIGTVLSLSLVPIILPIFVVFYLFSLFVSLLIRMKYGKRAKKATGTDVLSGKETEESRPIINVAFRFCGNLNIEKFRSRILDVVTNSLDPNGNRRYQRLMQIYCKEFGYNVWKDAVDFNIDHHIRVIKLEELVYRNIEKELGVANRIEDLKNLAESSGCLDWSVLMKCFLNEYGAEKMSRDIPQWQLLVVKETEDRYSALFRFHHAIADGIYVSRMLCEDFLDSPTELFHSYHPPSKLESWLRKLWGFSLLPFGIWKIVKNDDKNVLHGPKLCGKKKYYLSKSITLDILRRIRKLSTASIHAVLFSCLSTSLASHFKRRSTVVEAVTTLIPMPLQNLLKPIRLRNKFAVVSLKLPTLPPKTQESICNEVQMKGSLHRLKDVKRILENAKMDPTFLAVHSLITAFCSFLPSSLAESLLSAKGCTVAFSNLPGPQDEIYFWNDRIEEVMFWIPDRDPMGVGLSILSYNGHLRAGLALDERIIESDREGDLFLQDFEAEIDNLLEELGDLQIASEDSKTEESELLKDLP